MNKTRFGFLILIFVFLLPVFTEASDFGLLLNQHMGFGYTEVDENFFEYNASIIPRFSFLIGETGSFFISASLTIGYKDEFYIYPELLRTEFAMRFGSIWMRAGRIGYSDPLTNIAEGLFDGFHVTHTSSLGRFGFGTWYTGLLYKKNVNITMTAEDQALHSAPLAYDDFFDTYFAPRRILAAINWEHLAIANILRINSAILGQIDISKGDEKYHSQYLIVKAGLPINKFLFEAGGSIETAQMKLENEKDFSFKLGLAGELGAYWTPPLQFNSLLSFVVRYTSGKKGDTLCAFNPVTTKYYGDVFKARLSGITIFSLNYSARIIDPLGANLNVSYFVRNDKETQHLFPMTSVVSDNKCLGAEIYGNVVWSIFSDLQLNLGAGIFSPSMGNVWKEGKTLWKVDLTAVLAIY